MTGAAAPRQQSHDGLVFLVTSAAGETRTAAAFVGPGGRARVLRRAWVTADRYPVGTVLCVHDKEMKQAWCLAPAAPVRLRGL